MGFCARNVQKVVGAADLSCALTLLCVTWRLYTEIRGKIVLSVKCEVLIPGDCKDKKTNNTRSTIAISFTDEGAVKNMYFWNCVACIFSL